MLCVQANEISRYAKCCCWLYYHNLTYKMIPWHWANSFHLGMIFISLKMKNPWLFRFDWIEFYYPATNYTEFYKLLQLLFHSKSNWNKGNPNLQNRCCNKVVHLQCFTLVQRLENGILCTPAATQWCWCVLIISRNLLLYISYFTCMMWGLRRETKPAHSIFYLFIRSTSPIH